MPADPPFQAISAAVSGLVAASQTGFTISENGAKPLLAAIEDLQEQVRDALSQSHRLELQPPLGDTPNAKVYKPFLATIASDPTQGSIPALRILQGSLNDAHAAITKAMNNYENTEHGNVAKVNGAETWL